jgi:hypothetical protein
LVRSLKPEDYDQVAATLSKLTEAVRELEQAKVKE